MSIDFGLLISKARRRLLYWSPDFFNPEIMMLWLVARLQH
jgi:hypothetical protein